MPFEIAWAFPKFNEIVPMTYEEFAKIREDSCWLDLVGIDGQFEDFSYHVNEVSNNNDFWHVIKI